jgi:hypothetical protein
VGADRTSGGIASRAYFTPGFRVVPFGLVFRLGFRQGIVQGLLFCDEFPDFLCVNAIDQAALLRHFFRKVLA